MFVIAMRVYLTAHEHIGLFVESAKPFLRGHRPAATLLVLEHLSNPALLVQIEAVAVARR